MKGISVQKNYNKEDVYRAFPKFLPVPNQQFYTPVLLLAASPPWCGVSGEGRSQGVKGSVLGQCGAQGWACSPCSGLGMGAGRGGPFLAFDPDMSEEVGFWETRVWVIN